MGPYYDAILPDYDSLTDKSCKMFRRVFPLVLIQRVSNKTLIRWKNDLEVDSPFLGNDH